MRVCRFRHHAAVACGYYYDDVILPFSALTTRFPLAAEFAGTDCLLDVLPPDGPQFKIASEIASQLETAHPTWIRELGVAANEVELLVPIPRPNKLFLLAGNYNEHIQEGGGTATERAETFPYVFMKPPSTTLTNPSAPIWLPSISPGAIDWEIELAAVIGRRCKGVKAAEALGYLAGYTIVNDISDRKFRPNVGRKKRDRDSFFDWLHGKWHDSFCPCGPCIVSRDSISDPQRLSMRLTHNGRTMQDASTAQQIFPVAAVIEFISSFVTLEPGDLISTGTPAGVGNTTGTYLRAGDEMEGTIESIGVLRTSVRA